ncbi:MAG TPA: TlyA family RNA methyltransferase [Clostridia bacterium]|jgi:23S rRNA (cytidine1920-2'-O)/16S rRNA (cytidine1409-2'-O)-methyltransferase|nr:TlyA family RNA methyltransferase [Clostridia bacterium]
MRLDQYLVFFNFTDSRNRAANLIKLGKIAVNGKTAEKPAMDIKEWDKVTLIENYPASLGGIKLNEAFEKWEISAIDKVCLDVGASNGGFTEILLRRGAKLVYALDVGECALPDYLRANESVIVKDRTNARFITKDDFTHEIDFAVIDVSFISLELVFPPVYEVVKSGGEIVALIKPQFEVTPKDLTKSGIVKDEKTREKAVKKIVSLAIGCGTVNVSTIPAPHPFEDKNQEYLIYVRKP